MLELNSEVSVWADLDMKCTKGYRKDYEGHLFYLGNGNLLKTRDDVFSSCTKTSGIAVEMTEMEYQYPALNSLDPIVFPQNLPSIMAAELLNVTYYAILHLIIF